jgi:hypothetical protein
MYHFGVLKMTRSRRNMNSSTVVPTLSIRTFIRGNGNIRLLLCLLVCLALRIGSGHAQDDTPEPLPDTSIECQDGGQLTCTLSDPDGSTIDYSGWFLNGRLLNPGEFKGNSFTFAIDSCGDFQITARGVGTHTSGLQFRNANGGTTFSRACPESSGQSSTSAASAAIDENLQIDNTASGNLQGIVIQSNAPGLQAKRVGPRAVGIKEIVDAGIIMAVNLWGADEATAEVCMPGSGPMLFKDASTTPHQVFSAKSFQRDGNTCTRISGPGTVIMVKDESANQGGQQSGASGQSQPAIQTTTASSNSPQWVNEQNCCYHPDWNCAATDNKAWQRGFFTYRASECELPQE